MCVYLYLCLCLCDEYICHHTPPPPYITSLCSTFPLCWSEYIDIAVLTNRFYCSVIRTIPRILHRSHLGSLLYIHLLWYLLVLFFLVFYRLPNHQRKKLRRRGIDYAKEVPFETQPPIGYYDTLEEVEESKRRKLDTNFTGPISMEGNNKSDHILFLSTLFYLLVIIKSFDSHLSCVLDLKFLITSSQFKY